MSDPLSHVSNPLNVYNANTVHSSLNLQDTSVPISPLAATELHQPLSSSVEIYDVDKYYEGPLAPPNTNGDEPIRDPLSPLSDEYEEDPLTSNGYHQNNSKTVPVQRVFELLVVIDFPSQSPKGSGSSTPNLKKSNSNLQVQHHKTHIRQSSTPPPTSELIAPNVPRIEYSFPPKIDPEFEQLSKSLPAFCFPDLDTMIRRFAMKTERFSFILTLQSGQRVYAYCRRSIPAENEDMMMYPQAFCMVSTMPNEEMINVMLGNIENLYNEDYLLAEELVSALYTSKPPLPGGSLKLTLPGPHESHYSFSRPLDSETNHVLADSVFKFISGSNLVALFAAMLAERKILLMGSQVTALTEIVQTLNGLLHPFAWQHILVPVLPGSMLSFCGAPFPFLIGILNTHFTQLVKMKNHLDGVLLFDIDKNYFIWGDNSDATELPQPIYQRLLDGVKRTNPYSTSLLNNKTRKPGNYKQENLDLLAEFQCFFLETMYKSDEAFESQPKGSTIPYVFNGQLFEANSPDLVKPFLTRFVTTQMFEQYVKEREMNRSLFVRPFETKCAELEKIEQRLRYLKDPSQRSIYEKERNALLHYPQPSLSSKFAKFIFS